MKLPKIIFQYSYPYDTHWDAFIKQNSSMQDREILEKDEILNTVRQLEENWKIISRKILKEISMVLKLNWQEREIICYIVSNGRGLSDPMTIGINGRKLEKILFTLIHELTHRIFIQPESMDKAKEAWNLIKKEYSNESKMTQIHIICHSLLKHLYLKFFSEKALTDDIARCQKHQDYKRAWEIVESNDYENVLKRFVGKIV